MWGGGVGGGTPQTYVSVGLQMSAVGLKILIVYIDATFTAERQNIFDLIARDNHPTNFGCINVLSIDL